MTVATSSADRRRAPRRQPALGTFLRLELVEGQGKRLGLVWNISTSGVSLLFNEALNAMLKTGALKRIIGRMTPSDMPDFDVAMQLAVTALAKSDATNKHMIILSDGDPMEQVFAKSAGADLLDKVPVRGRDDPHIHCHQLGGSDLLKLLLLKGSQQLHLSR